MLTTRQLHQSTADGKTYVDLVGANNQSIDKIITLNGDYVLNEFTDLGSKGVELRFGELDDGAFQLTKDDDDFTGSLSAKLDLWA